MKLNKLKRLGLSTVVVLTMLMIGCSKDGSDISDIESSHMTRFEESVLLKTSVPVIKNSLKKKVLVVMKVLMLLQLKILILALYYVKFT